MGQGFTPFLLLLGFIGILIGIVRRDVAQILFVGFIIVPNTLFWVPNPSPARHYLPMAPALAAAAALGACWAVSKLPRTHPSWISRPWAYGSVAALCALAVSLIVHRAPSGLGEMKSPFVTRFSADQDRIRFSQLGDDLVSVKGSNRPTVVLCDSTFVAARMEEIDPSVRVYLHLFHMNATTPLGFHEVHERDRTFFMFEHSWIPAEVDYALDRLHLYEDDPVLVDPHNPAISYNGPRHRARLTQTPSGEIIQTD
jgi:hypothetical protein